MMKNTVREPVAGYERWDVEQFRKLNHVTNAAEGSHHIRPVRGAPEGNINCLKHGAYANRFLTAEEQNVFHDLVGRLREDFSFNASSDFVQVELASIYFLKIGRALEQDNIEAAHKLDQMLRGHLKDLKATKIAREGEEPKGTETTPAEWATALLEKLAESETKAKAEPEKTQE